MRALDLLAKLPKTKDLPPFGTLCDAGGRPLVFVLPAGAVIPATCDHVERAVEYREVRPTRFAPLVPLAVLRRLLQTCKRGTVEVSGRHLHVTQGTFRARLYPAPNVSWRPSPGRRMHRRLSSRHPAHAALIKAAHDRAYAVWHLTKIDRYRKARAFWNRAARALEAAER